VRQNLRYVYYALHSGPLGPYKHIPKFQVKDSMSARNRIPKSLVFGVDWLDVVSKSKLFSQLLQINSNKDKDEITSLYSTVNAWRQLFLELSRGEITFARASEVFSGVFDMEEAKRSGSSSVKQNDDFGFELDLMWCTCGPFEVSASLEKLKSEIHKVTKSVQKVKDQIRNQKIEREKKRRERARKLAERERQRELYGYFSLYGGYGSTRNRKRKVTEEEEEEEDEKDGGGFWGLLGMDYETKLRGLEDQHVKLDSQLRTAQRDLLRTNWVESSYKQGEDFSWTLGVKDGTGEIWTKLRLNELDKFRELRRVCGSLDVILGFLKTLNLFISPEGQEDVELLYGRLNQFRAAYVFFFFFLYFHSP
jgi:hypothetical protein